MFVTVTDGPPHISLRSGNLLGDILRPLTLADAVVGGATHVKACVAAAVLSPVHGGATRPPAERRVVHDAPLGWS